MHTGLILMLFFALIAILSLVSAIRSIKEKNILSLIIGLASFAVFGWFVFMTIFNSGYPAE